MENEVTMTLGERIRKIRTLKEFSLEYVSHITGYSIPTLSRVERGETDCNETMLNAIKKALGIGDAPLTREELLAFSFRLQRWYESIKAKNLDEANVIKKEVSVILHLPYEHEKITRYRIFEANLYMAERNLTDAEECLNMSREFLDETNLANMYYYYFSIGSLHFRRGLKKEALCFYLKAYDLRENAYNQEDGIYYNIAACYSNLCLPFHTIKFAQEFRANHKGDILKDLELYFGNLLAANYIEIGEVHIAKRLLDKSLIQAKSDNNDVYVGIITHNYGCLHKEKKEWIEAIRYFNRAFELFQDDKDFYLENLYQKIHCLILGGKRVQAKFPGLSDLLDEGMTLSDSKKYSILFESLGHSLTLGEKESLEYIETVTIPYLVEEYQHFKALEYCKLLKQHYIKTRKVSKSFEISEIENRILRKIIRGEVNLQ
ncbi:MAG: hypothetical protein FWC32_06305 [Firmicutes bacterium]|nr:hypothetical protein [Bacillota bacterium]